MCAAPLGRYALVEAPSVLGLTSRGVKRLPEALIGAGLAGRLGARLAGRVEPPRYDPMRDPETNMLNPRGVARYTVSLADEIEKVFDRDEVPLVLGGDCSILLGAALAMRRRERAGLLFVDGHVDFYQPDAEPRGEAASMDLALVTGRGPRVVVDPEGRAPLVRDEDVVAFGARDGEERRRQGSQPLPARLRAIELDEIRRLGVRPAVDAALAHLAPAGGFWLHLDADVLDDAVMLAVDYRTPGGLSFDELALVLAASVASGRVRGVDVTIYNPSLDPTGAAGRGLADTLARGLSRGS